MKIFRHIFCFLILALVLVQPAFADLSVTSDELTLQPASGVIHGRTVKIYTTVRNSGDADLIGLCG